MKWREELLLGLSKGRTNAIDSGQGLGHCATALGADSLTYLEGYVTYMLAEKITFHTAVVKRVSSTHFGLRLGALLGLLDQPPGDY